METSRFLRLLWAGFAMGSPRRNNFQIYSASWFAVEDFWQSPNGNSKFWFLGEGQPDGEKLLPRKVGKKLVKFSNCRKTLGTCLKQAEKLEVGGSDLNLF